MKHDPLTKQRSNWENGQSLGSGLTAWHRNVSDGHLVVLLANPSSPEKEWHLSISFRNHKEELSRYPTWDEIMHARIQLIPKNVAMHMIIPPLDGDDYVAVHPTTFHLHQYHEYPTKENSNG